MPQLGTSSARWSASSIGRHRPNPQGLALTVEWDAAEIATDRLKYGHLRGSDASWSANRAASSIGRPTGDQR
jgi:hypothetical protein